VSGGVRACVGCAFVSETAQVELKSGRDRGVIENNVSTDGQIAINRQIDVRELRVIAHTIVCGRSAITN